LHDRLGITWQLSDLSGWGVFGWNLVTELLARGRPRPLLLTEPDPQARNGRFRATVQPFLAEQAELAAMAAGRPAAVARLPSTVVLHHLGNDLQISEVSRHFEGEVNCGVVFFESAELSPEALRQAARFDRIVAGCTWNGDVLKARGLTNVEVVLQGIDLATFYPAPRTDDLFPGRFVVFSGGKLEYRKGQDIVLAAFRTFQKRHPEALLITLWQNLWPKSSDTLVSSPHVSGPPEIDPDGRQNMLAWAADNGLPAESFLDLGLVPNAELAPILRQADVAVFPNRCEGGTNLVAMECMACGLPTVLSANTGHLDLIDDGVCYPLTDQGSVAGPGRSTEGWGESSVGEVVENLERIYGDQQEAVRRGAGAVMAMERLSWRNQVAKLLAAIGEA
jgi:glycosyltransferase involved in cell wall biosynthesis